MSMSIKIKDTEGKEYTLEYTRKTIRQMAQNGFNIDNALDNPVLGIPELFAGAFLRYHRTISREQVDKIWDTIGDKEEFITMLVKMYREPVNVLFGEPEDETKKSAWEVVK